MSIHTEQIPQRVVNRQNLTGVRRFIFEQAREHRQTLADLSRGAGKNHSYMHQFLYRRTPEILPEDVRHAVAAMLGLPEARLRQDRRNPDEFAMVPPDAVEAARELDVTRVVPPPAAVSTLPAAERVPLFLDIDEILPASATEWSQWPGPVTGPIAGAFGIRVSSARGRFNPGDVIFARPRLPAREGDSVIGLRATAIEVIGELMKLGPESATIQDGPGAPKTVHLDGLRLLKVTAAYFA